MPFFDVDSRTLKSYIENHSAPTGWWHNFDKYIISLLKAWYGEASTDAQEWQSYNAAAASIEARVNNEVRSRSKAA